MCAADTSTQPVSRASQRLRFKSQQKTRQAYTQENSEISNADRLLNQLNSLQQQNETRWQHLTTRNTIRQHAYQTKLIDNSVRKDAITHESVFKA